MDLEAQVHAELEQICQSPDFASKKQTQNFLRYIVNETLAGRGSRISQYALAIEALGKPADFNPNEDSSVRMQANRLRKLLDKYYSKKQQTTSISITLLPGSYQPHFKSSNRFSNLLEKTHAVSSLSMGPKVLINTYHNTEQSNDTLKKITYEIHSGISLLLSRFREVRIIIEEIKTKPPENHDEFSLIWEKYQAEFLLVINTYLNDNYFELHYTVTHTLTNHIVGRHKIKLNLNYYPRNLDLLYKELLENTISLHKGIILGFWSKYWYHQANIPEHYQVLVKHIYFMQIDSSLHNLGISIDICEKRLQRYQDDALAALHYAILCLYAYIAHYPLKQPIIELWPALARKSLELNPWNALAHGIYAITCALRGDYDLCKIEITAAKKANPLDNSCSYLMAVGLCSLGHWSESIPLLQEAAHIHLDHPKPFKLIPCLYFFRKGQMLELADTSSCELNAKMLCLVGDCGKNKQKNCFSNIDNLVNDYIKQSEGAINNRNVTINNPLTTLSHFTNNKF